MECGLTRLLRLKWVVELLHASKLLHHIARESLRFRLVGLIGVGISRACIKLYAYGKYCASPTRHTEVNDMLVMSLG